MVVDVDVNVDVSEDSYLQMATLILFMNTSSPAPVFYTWTKRSQGRQEAREGLGRSVYLNLYLEGLFTSTYTWQFCSPVLVEVDLLQDAVTADRQQHVLLHLLVLGESLHCVKVSLQCAVCSVQCAVCFVRE